MRGRRSIKPSNSWSTTVWCRYGEVRAAASSSSDRNRCCGRDRSNCGRGDIESLVENIELREALTGLLGVSAARAKLRDPDQLRELGELADAISAGDHSFEHQRLIWRGHRILTDMADNASLRFIYRNLLDAAEALIIQIEFPNAGPGADRERLRRDAHAGLFRAVLAGDIHAAWTFGETVRVVSPHGRDKQLVSVDGSGPARLVSAESPVTAAAS